MISTSGATLLFCEGEPTSLDHALLSYLPYRTSPRLIPAGGKQGIPSFVSGALSGRPEEPPYLVFRDRDLDAEPPQQPQLVQLHPTKPIYSGYRSCIESYFLSGTVMVTYWNEALTKRGPSPLSSTQFDGVIEVAARKVADYQAVRWGLKKLAREHYATDLPDKLADDSGGLPADLSYAGCVDDATSVINGYRANAGARTPELFRTYASEYRARFQDQRFFTLGAFLVWFHGKDLKTAFQTELERQHPNLNFPTDHYMKWAAGQMARWYQQYPDLVELVDRVG